MFNVSDMVALNLCEVETCPGEAWISVDDVWWCEVHADHVLEALAEDS